MRNNCQQGLHYPVPLAAQWESHDQSLRMVDEDKYGVLLAGQCVCQTFNGPHYFSDSLGSSQLLDSSRVTSRPFNTGATRWEEFGPPPLGGLGRIL